MRLYKTIGLLLFLALAFLGTDVQAQTGAYDIKVKLSDLVKPDELTSLDGFYSSDHIFSWRLYVPKDYDPDKPPGILVYISPTKSGDAPSGWHPVLEQENIIYISAHRAGNFIPAKQRMANAVFALSYVTSNFRTDPDLRIISGFSGGARVSTIMTEIMPKLFTGGIFIGGAYAWEGSGASMKETLSGGTYVFITGKRDHARFETVRTYRQYDKTGVANVKLIDDYKLGHQLPSTKEFAEAIAFFTEEKQD